MEKVPKDYCPVKNSIVEKLARTNLSPYESRVVWAIIRKTYGWKNKSGGRKVSDKISLSQLSQKKETNTKENYKHSLGVCPASLKAQSEKQPKNYQEAKAIHSHWPKHDHQACWAIYSLISELKKKKVDRKTFAAWHRTFYCMLYLFRWDYKKLAVFITDRVNNYKKREFKNWWYHNLLEDAEKSPMEIDWTEYERLKKEEINWGCRRKLGFISTADMLSGVLETIGIHGNGVSTV